MKRVYNYMFLLMASLVLALTGCQKEEIVFDHEQPQFEIDAEAILLEVIVPNGTSSDEAIYITGAFSGGEKYQLEKAKMSDKKWGIYLYETDFVAGKTLEDGFYFISDKNGAERSVKGDTVMHTLKASYGTRTNVWIDSWEAFFKSGDITIEHDGYVAYVIDETGWDALALYAWGDAEAFGGWPGIQPTGVETVNGVKYTYFDLGAANEGLNLNLIFNNNGNNKQLGDFNFTVERNVFLKLTEAGAEEITPAEPGTVFPTLTHDGDAVYFCNNAGWENVHLYMWGATNDLNGGWPGMEPTGKFKYKGFDWYYFDLGAANEGQEEHLIVNDGNGTQIDDIVVYTLTGGDSTFYFLLNPSKKIVRIDDPLTYEYPSVDGGDGGGETGGNDPVVVVPDTITTRLYFLDASDATKPNVYSWGNDDQGTNQQVFGGWPGVAWTEWQKVTFLGTEFYYYEFEAVEGQVCNLIINGEGEGNQYDAMSFTVGTKTDIYLEVGTTGATELVATPKGLRRK